MPAALNWCVPRRYSVITGRLGELCRCDTYLNKIERVLVTATGELAPGAQRELVARQTPDFPLSKPYGLAVYEGLSVVRSLLLTIMRITNRNDNNEHRAVWQARCCGASTARGACAACAAPGPRARCTPSRRRSTTCASWPPPRAQVRHWLSTGSLPGSEPSYCGAGPFGDGRVL